MEHATSARLTAAAGRRFAFTLAAAFGVFFAIALWRGADRAVTVFGALAALLFLLGAFVPTRLGPLERSWMALGRVLSRITTPIIFTLLWWIAVVPTGVVRRTFGRSPLARDSGASSFWHARAPKTPDVARRAMERQF